MDQAIKNAEAKLDYRTGIPLYVCLEKKGWRPWEPLKKKSPQLGFLLMKI
jgi:hypothetical protein